MLADDQVQLRVVSHAVAFVRRTFDLDDATPGIPASAHVGGHVGKQQILIHGVPDRPSVNSKPVPVWPTGA